MKQQTSNARYFQLNCVSALSFSKKADYCAVATKKDHLVRIYKVNNLTNINSWAPLQEIKDHTQTIGDIDWSADNKIVTSSHDRSVYVWRQTSQTRWEKMLVNIDIKLSILVSKWAPSAKKFALGSTCNTLALGFYNTTEQCWTVAPRTNLFKSSITTLCFHPSSNLIAAGSTDCQFKIIAVSFKGSKDEAIRNSNIEQNSYTGPFQGVQSLFEVLYTVQNLGGWINYINFNDNGTQLLIVPHTNHIKAYEIAENQKVVVAEEDIRWSGLPFLSGYFNKNRDIILGGFDKKVAKFVKKGNYTFERYCEQNEKTGAISKVGLVANLTKGIQKRQTIFGKGPLESQHINAIKVSQVQGFPVSFDVNGNIHFWKDA